MALHRWEGSLRQRQIREWCADLSAKAGRGGRSDRRGLVDSYHGIPSTPTGSASGQGPIDQTGPPERSPGAPSSCPTPTGTPRCFHELHALPRWQWRGKCLVFEGAGLKIIVFQSAPHTPGPGEAPDRSQGQGTRDVPEKEMAGASPARYDDTIGFGEARRAVQMPAWQRGLHRLGVQHSAAISSETTHTLGRWPAPGGAGERKLCCLVAGGGGFHASWLREC